MIELLQLLKDHPELVSGLVFDATNVRCLLKTRAARRLVIGVDTKAFLSHVADSKGGGPIAMCVGQTVSLCAGTILCLGGTKPTKRCKFTKPTRVG
jgi:hypothetical protein